MKIDFYTQIHKALRRLLFNLSIKIGAADWTNPQICKEIYDELLQLIALLKVHAHHEEKYFHPLIAKKLKKEEMELHHEHQSQDQLLEELIALTTNKKEKNNDQGLKVYRAFNRFIAYYLEHLEKEESIMPILIERSTIDELLSALNGLIQSFTPQELNDSLVYMLPALNPQERANFTQVAPKSSAK